MLEIFILLGAIQGLLLSIAFFSQKTTDNGHATFFVSFYRLFIFAFILISSNIYV